MAFEYEKNPAEIYRRSFETVRHEADLERFNQLESEIAVRLIHACGMPDVSNDLQIARGAAEAGRAALLAGAPILVDCEMAGAGIIRKRLPRDNPVICTLNDERVPGLAADEGTTRSAAAVGLWTPHLDGAVVAIGNAPTALFRLMEEIDAGAPMPAAILGFPVGFVGAAESKQALSEQEPELPYITLLGRRGGSAMASAAVNALALQGDQR